MRSEVNPRPDVADVKAEDYITPQKYLDGAEIPTFYQFQSNMVRTCIYIQGSFLILPHKDSIQFQKSNFIRFRSSNVFSIQISDLGFQV